jgi:prepilin-type N-terminal cleavage/methylation domain-containing protein
LLPPDFIRGIIATGSLTMIMTMNTKAQSGANATHRTSNRGFSLIELLVVVAIILIIAAIAIPNLLNSRMAANGAAAVENVRTITTAAMAYSSTYGNGFPATLAVMGGPSGGVSTCDAAILLDPIISAPPYQKSGYTFAYSVVGAPVIAPAGCSQPGTNAYLVTAVPITVKLSGIDSYCTDEPGTIHFDTTGSPAADQAACEALPALQ